MFLVLIQFSTLDFNNQKELQTVPFIPINNKLEVVALSLRGTSVWLATYMFVSLLHSMLISILVIWRVLGITYRPRTNQWRYRLSCYCNVMIHINYLTWQPVYMDSHWIIKRNYWCYRTNNIDSLHYIKLSLWGLINQRKYILLFM